MAETRLHVPLLRPQDDDRQTAQENPHVTTLLQGNFSSLINHLETDGVKKLGSFKVNAYVAETLMGGEPMLTQGSGSASLAWDQMWEPQLQQAEAHVRLTSQGWQDDVSLDVYLLRIAAAAHPDEQGLLRYLVSQYRKGNMDMRVFGLPAVQALIHFKWWRYSKRLLMSQLALYLVWLTAYTTFCVKLPEEDHSLTLAEVVKTPAGQVNVVCQVVCLVIMVPFLYQDLTSMMAYSLHSWTSRWNLLNKVSYMFQITISALYLVDSLRPWTSTTAFDALVAAHVATMYLRLQYYTRIFHPARPSFVDTMADVFLGLADLMAVFILLIWAFALAFYTLFTNDVDKEQFASWRELWSSMVAAYSALRGGLDYHSFFDSSSPVLMTSVFVVFQFTVVTCLSRIITGAIIRGTDEAAGDVGLKALLTKASIIDEGDALMPAWVERWLGHPNGWFPTYIYILKVDPKSLDSVKTQSDWAVEGQESSAGDEGTAEGTAEPGSGEVAELKGKVAELRGQVADMKHMVRALCKRMDVKA
eukprot:CAMPEP_0202890610 /NCGR_PEP_ID=MMETSP1392-20130828/957_1 /ASSEMBLY_ACC=CAM_ASM_000868 /TAXON_ID=225041 /ORGANISM="Chlamydomonas chlamydogama, Strain SAG 11-48b" /LENGTH=529 /DNA_ID=CAMNT_0049574211 /DNA_START=43 /DNA_END=1632 /DNA_ORIENTATION=+